MKLFAIASIALAGIGIQSSLAAEPGQRDLSVVQNQAYEAGKPRPGSLSVLTLLDRADATYALGETVRLSVKTNADAYVTVLNIGASGRVVRLFPNSAQPDNRVRGGTAIAVPSAASGAAITVSGPVGAELIKVIATSRPLTVIREEQLSGTGLFRTLEGDTDALERDLTVVTANPPTGTDVAVVNQVIRTIPARTGADQQAVVPQGTRPVIGDQGAQHAAVRPVVAAPAQPSSFPLLLAADKPTYRVGERVVLAVTPLEACHLTILSANASGQIRQLYPTRALPGARLAAQKTVMISGGSSPQTVVASGPGAETITAYCSRDAQPSRVVRAADEILPSQEQEDVERSLTVTAAKPAQQIGHAQVTITVTP